MACMPASHAGAHTYMIYIVNRHHKGTAHVGLNPVTRACSVHQTSPLVTGDLGGVHRSKAVGGLFIAKDFHHGDNRVNSQL